MTDLATVSSSPTTTSSPCIPPGFRFHPTDEELTGYYLRKKVASHKIDLDVIREIDLYKIEPWDLEDKCGMGYEEQKEWYFFSHKDKKYPTGTRTNRATMAGFWKATGRDKAVYDVVNKAKLIGMRKTLVFYKGRAPNGHKTDWIMHEYRLLHDSQDMIIINTPPQEEEWVVCRAFKKRSQTKINNNIINNEKWETSAAYSFLDQPTGSIDPSQHAQQQPGSVSEYSTVVIGNKPETVEAADIVQLPPLEITPQDSDDIINCNPKNSTVRTNWRDLDKFVASQLSHGDPSYDVDQYSRSSFEAISNYCDFKDRSDLAMLLPQSGGVELVTKLSSTSVDSYV